MKETKPDYSFRRQVVHLHEDEVVILDPGLATDSLVADMENCLFADNFVKSF